jgi:hypothetical protein
MRESRLQVVDFAFEAMTTYARPHMLLCCRRGGGELLLLVDTIISTVCGVGRATGAGTKQPINRSGNNTGRCIYYRRPKSSMQLETTLVLGRNGLAPQSILN